jgi:hypothetical protein
MTNSQPPPNIEVSAEHADEFIQSLRTTLKRMTRSQRKDVRLIVQKRQAVAISCDSKNLPFLGYTVGYNQPDARTALPLENFVLYEIRKWLLIRRKRGPKGGRVFITSECAFTAPENEPIIILCKWNWPREDIVIEVLSLLDESLSW